MTERTVTEALSTAQSGLGQWWPNAWWPGGNSTFNDCAAFVSWALYGLVGGRPAYTYVPHLMERAIRERRWYGGSALAGRPQDGRHAAGMVPGDVVVLDWRFRGSRDHVGLFLGYVGKDYIRVRQANNGGGGNGNAAVRDPAEDVTYHRRFVLGYYRPPYRTLAPAGGKPIDILEDFMATLSDRGVQLFEHFLNDFTRGVSGFKEDGLGWRLLQSLADRSSTTADASKEIAESTAATAAASANTAAETRRTANLLSPGEAGVRHDGAAYRAIAQTSAATEKTVAAVSALGALSGGGAPLLDPVTFAPLLRSLLGAEGARALAAELTKS